MSEILIPPVDIIETAEGITLRADMPGVWKEGVTVNVDGENLAIEGEVRLGEAAQMQGVYAEVRQARYKRSFVLSRDLDASKIDATVQDGVLTLQVPKVERAKPRKIDVRVS
jgi:HSP20 family molecular chaperone IbpA